MSPAIFTWTGGAADNNWRTQTTVAPGVVVSNWRNEQGLTNVIPNPGDDLVFPSGVPADSINNTNDYPVTGPNNVGTLFRSITISGTGYVLGGNGITLGTSASGSGFITSNAPASTNSIAFTTPIRMGGTANTQFFTVNSQGAILTITARIESVATPELDKNGFGTLILNADNSGFLGNIVVVEGTLTIQNANALGNTGGITTVLGTVGTGGRLFVDNGGGTITTKINEPLSLNGPGPDTLGALVNLAGNSIWAGPVSLAGDSTLGSQAGALSIEGVISDVGVRSLTKERPGKIIFDPVASAAGNSYRGKTIINDGILAIRHSLALGNQSPTSTNDTVVNSAFDRSGTLQLESVATAGRIEPNPIIVSGAVKGFNVTQELLTLNGPGFEGVHALPKSQPGPTLVSGALHSLSGNNTWAQNISLWSGDANALVFDTIYWDWGTVGIGVEAGSELTITGRVIDTNITYTTLNPVAFRAGGTDTAAGYSFIKTRPGRLILQPNVNGVGTLNTYRGMTEILEGFLNIRDSAALGAGGSALNGTIVFPGGTLELEADGIVDSSPPPLSGPLGDHLPTDIVITAGGEQLSLMGNGQDGDGNGFGDGALRSVLGTNEDTGNIPLRTFLGRGTYAGTLPTPVPAPTGPQRTPTTVFEVSFSTTGASIGVEPDRIQLGQDPNRFNLSQFTVSGNISGANLTKVGTGELVLSPETNPGTIFATPSVLGNVYTGDTYVKEGWITVRHDYALGNNDPNVNFGVGSRPDTIQPATYVNPGAAIHVKSTRQGNQAIELDERLFISGNGISHRYAELNQRGALLNLDGLNTWEGIINLVPTANSIMVGIGSDIANSPYVTTDPLVTTSELFIVNLIQEALFPTGGTFTTAGIVNTSALVPTGIEKLGRKRVHIQGQGTYTGDNRITEGVLRAQTDTALGLYRAGTVNGQPAVLYPTTTVMAGAALEMKGYVPELHGHVPGGIHMRGNLILNGTGNTTADDPTHDFTNPPVISTSQGTGFIQTLTNLSDDNIWNGPITVNRSNEIQTIKIPVAQVSGTFTISMTGFGTTTALNFDATAAAVQSALQAILPAGGTVSVTLIDRVYTITFGGNLAESNLPRMTVAGSAGATVGSINDGSKQVNLDIRGDAGATSRLALWKSIAGQGGFDKNGPGKMVLGGQSTFTGEVNINTGSVNIQSSTALGSTAGGTRVSTLAQVELQGDLTISGEPLIVEGAGPGTNPDIALRWFPMGPGPITDPNVAGSKSTGRLTDVVADPHDPNVLYASAADGGAWRSKNNGLTWEPLIDNASVAGATGVDVLFTGTIATSPAEAVANAPDLRSSKYIYVGMGEPNNSIDSYYGRGILRSQDYGATWDLIPAPAPGFDRQSISKIVVDPVYADVIYVAVQGNAINGVDGAPGVTSYGIWRYDARVGTPTSGWVSLTQGQVPTGVTTVFDDSTQIFSDLVVINSNPKLTVDDSLHARHNDWRVIAFALGDPTGVTDNAVYVWSDGSTGTPSDALGSPGAGSTNTWNSMGFDVAVENVPGLSGVTYLSQPKYGTIKLAATRGNNGNLWTDTITLYAVTSFPTSGPRVDQGTDGRFRNVHVATIGYNRLDQTPPDRWILGSFGAMGTQPPGAGSTNAPIAQANSGPNANLGGRTAWYNLTIAVSPINASYVFVAGVSGSGDSSAGNTDGPYVWNGTAWADVNTTIGGGPHVNYHSTSWDSARRLLVATDGGIWRLNNTTPPAAGQQQWENLNGNFLQVTQFNGIDSDPNDPFVAIGGSQSNGVSIYDDSANWIQTASGHAGIVSISRLNPLIVFYASDGNLRRSIDGGQTWTTIVANLFQDRTNITPSPTGVNNSPANTYPSTVYNPSFPTTSVLNFPFAYDRVNPSRLLYADGAILRESKSSSPVDDPSRTLSVNDFVDIGTPQNANFGRILQIALPERQGKWVQDPAPFDVEKSTNKGQDTYDGTTIWVLGTNGITITKDGNLWVRRNGTGVNALPGPFNEYFDLVVDPTNRDIAFVTRKIYDDDGGPDNHIYRTTDAGLTWVDITGSGLPADLPAWKVAVNSRNGEVYLGTDNGVYVLPQGASFINDKNENVIPENAGPFNWQRFGVGMPDVQVKALVYNPKTNTLVAGTYGRGMFELWLDNTMPLSGAVRVIAGRSVWTGDVVLSGEVDIRADINAQLEILGTISEQGGGTFDINKYGPGLVVFAGNNTGYNGQIDVWEGTLGVRDQNALGNASGLGGVSNTIVHEGASLQLQKDLAGETIYLRGNGIQFNDHYTGALRSLTGTNNTFTGTLVLDVPAPGPFHTPSLPTDDPSPQITIGVEDQSTLTIGNGTIGTIIDGSTPSVTLTKEGVGKLVFRSANSYTGVTQINQGVLLVAHSQGLGDNSGVPTLGTKVRDGAQLQLDVDVNNIPINVVGESLLLSGIGRGDDTDPQNPDKPGALRNVKGNNTWSGPVTFQAIPSLPAPPPPLPPGTDLTTTNPIDRAGKVSIFVAQDTLTINGVIDEVTPELVVVDPNDPVDGQRNYVSFGLDKDGPGVLALTQNNTYTGITNVLEGTLSAQAPGALGSTVAGTVVTAGATLELSSAAGINPYDDETLTLNGTGVGNKGALYNALGNNTWQGDILLGNAVADVAFGAAANTQVTITGVVQDPSAFTSPLASVQKVGLGRVIFDSANTYGGKTTVKAGILTARDNRALGVNAPEVQVVTLLLPTGFFQLRLSGPNGSMTTGSIGFNATAATVKAQIDALLGNLGYVGPNSSVVRGFNAGGQVTYTISFGGGQLGVDMPQMTDAQPPGSTPVTINTLRQGFIGDTLVETGGTLQIQGGSTIGGGSTPAEIAAWNEPLTINGPGHNNLGALQGFSDTTSSGENFYDSTITLGSSSFIGVEVNGVPTTGNGLTIRSTITDGASTFGVTKVGTGTLTYAGNTSNTYDGLTKVNEGTLVLNKNAPAIPFDGNLEIGDTIGAVDSAAVRLAQSNEIPNDALTTIFSDGLLDLNSFSEAIDNLLIRDGHARTGAGSLTLNSSLDMIGGDIELGASGNQLNFGAAATITATSSATETARIRGTGGAINLAGATNRTFNVPNGPQASDLQIEALTPISGSASNRLIKDGAGLMEIDSNSSVTFPGTTEIKTGTLQVDGVINAVSLSGGTLAGNGTVGPIAGNAGTSVGIVSPGQNITGPPIGSLRTNGNSSWGPQTTYTVDLDKDIFTATRLSDVLVVNGNIDLGNAILTGTLTDNVELGDFFTIVQTTGGGNIFGKFAQIGGADKVFIGGKKFNILYEQQFDGVNDRVRLERVLATATVDVAPTANPSRFGQYVTFTITVVPEVGAPNVPDDDVVRVTFDGRPPVELSLTNGVAVYDPGNKLTVGTHPLDVIYLGHDNIFDVSPNKHVDQVVIASDTTTTLPDAPLRVAVYGQQLLVRAVIAAVAPGQADPALGLPTGTVTFTVFGPDGPDADLLPDLVRTVVMPVVQTPFIGATLDITDLAGGPIQQYIVRAEYSGNTALPGNKGFNGSSTTQDLVIDLQKANVDVAITPTPSSSPGDVNVTFNVTVTARAPSTGTPQGPSGTVNFYNGTTFLGSRQLSPSGMASLTTGFGLAGTLSIKAEYLGDGNYLPQSTTIQYVVGRTTTTTITQMPFTPVAGHTNPVTGQGVTFLAQVLDSTNGAPLPTNGTTNRGTVTFFVNGVAVHTMAVNALGQASVTLKNLQAGSNSIHAVYNGNSRNAVSTSAPVTRDVDQANTSVSLVSARPGSSIYKQSVTFTATVSAVAPGGGIVPVSGTVTFRIDAGTANERVYQAGITNGKAYLSLTAAAGNFLSFGAHTVTATYDGDANYVTSSSNSVNQTIIPVLKVFLSPAAPSVGVPFNVTVVAYDVNNNIVGYNGPATIQLSNGASAYGIVSGPQTIQFVNGVARFTNRIITRAGTWNLRVVSGLAISPVFTVSNGRVS